MSSRQESAPGGTPFAWTKCGHPTMPTGPEECVTCLRQTIESMQRVIDALEGTKDELNDEKVAAYAEIDNIKLQIDELTDRWGRLRDKLNGIRAMFLGADAVGQEDAAPADRGAVCVKCSGSGGIGLIDDEVPCPVCGGSGDPTRPGAFAEKRACAHKSGTLNPGTGEVKCHDCGQNVKER